MGGKMSQFPGRRGFTVIRLWLAIMLTAMVVAVIAAVAQGVQTSFEYSEAYGTATQHARVAWSGSRGRWTGPRPTSSFRAC